MAGFNYDVGMYGIATGAIDWVSDTFKARLISVSATPSRDDVDLSDPMYDPIGDDQILITLTPALDTVNHRTKFQAGDPTFPPVGGLIQIGGCVLYKDDGGDGVPITYFEFDDPITPIGVPIMVDLDALGALYLNH